MTSLFSDEDEVVAWSTLKPSRIARASCAVPIELLERLGEALESQQWVRLRQVLRCAEGDPEIVDEQRWAEASDRQRFALFDSLSAAEWSRIDEMSELMRYVRSHETAALLSVALQQAVRSRPIVSVSRYGLGGFLSPHSDAFDGRVCGVIVNLTNRPWREQDGGVLGYRNEEGEMFKSPPRQGSVALLPFVPGSSHWVSKVRGEGLLRYSIALHYLRA